MSTLAGRRGMRPKMMMPFDAQPPQRKCVFVCVSERFDHSFLIYLMQAMSFHFCHSVNSFSEFTDQQRKY